MKMMPGIEPRISASQTESFTTNLSFSIDFSISVMGIYTYFKVLKVSNIKSLLVYHKKKRHWVGSHGIPTNYSKHPAKNGTEID